MKFLLVTLLAAAASASFAPLYTAKERIDGSYIVVLNDGESLSAAVNNLRDSPFFSILGGHIRRVYGSVLNGFSATLGDKALEFIRSMDIVKYVEEDGIVRASAVDSWGLDRIDQRSPSLDGYYSPSGDGAGVHVYVIDTGIRRTHADFGIRVGIGRDFVDNDIDASDCDGHGTHCAGTVGGSSKGVATGVFLYGVRVLNCLGSGYNSDVIAGVNWVRDEHLYYNEGLKTSASVASMSLGGGISVALDSAINNLVDAGVPTTVAAGNENTDACDSSPARVEKAITVGATATVLSNDVRSTFSNYGSCVDIFAPGSDITSTWWTSDIATNTISGTSMACPHVAGAAAIALGENPSLTPTGVTSKLILDATSNVVGDVQGSPNRLLYVG